MLDRLPRRSENSSGSDPNSFVRTSVTGLRNLSKHAGSARWNVLVYSMNLDPDSDGTKSSCDHSSRLTEGTENDHSERLLIRL